MVRFEWLYIVLTFCAIARCENLVVTNADQLKNLPSESSAESKSSPVADESQAQARFLPFSASFSLSAGNGNAQTFSIAGSPDGIGVSQSASHAAGGNSGSFTASQSSSLAAGVNGVSGSDSSSVATNHPIYGQNAQSSSNSFGVGQAEASSHGDVVNGQAITSAQSSVGGTHSQAGSNSQNYIQLQPERPGQWHNVQPNYASGHNGDYYYNSQRKPTLSITVADDRTRYGTRPSNGWYEVQDSRDSWNRPDYCNYNGWYRDPRCRTPKVTVTKPVHRPGYQKPYYENIREPRVEIGGVKITQATAGSSAQSKPGLSITQSASQSHLGGHRPSSTTPNRVEVSSSAQAHAQGGLSEHQQKHPGELQLSSASPSINRRPGGFAQSSSSASSGSIVTFPGPSSHQQIIPKEFIRSKRPKDDEDGPLEEIVSELTDAVYEILDY